LGYRVFQFDTGLPTNTLLAHFGVTPLVYFITLIIPTRAVSKTICNDPKLLVYLATEAAKAKPQNARAEPYFI